MVNKILFWTSFGLIVRWWQLGIQMQPPFLTKTLWVYPVFGGVGASFGYWLQNVEDKQIRYLQEAKDKLLERRKRRQEREEFNAGNAEQKHEHGLVPTPTA